MSKILWFVSTVVLLFVVTTRRAGAEAELKQIPLTGNLMELPALSGCWRTLKDPPTALQRLIPPPRTHLKVKCEEGTKKVVLVRPTYIK